MNRYVLSPRARDDLRSIWRYTTNRWGTEQAEKYLRQIQRAVEAVASNPALGQPCDEIRPAYRKHRVGSHIIFYRIVEPQVDVVRILHARMDFDRHL